MVLITPILAGRAAGAAGWLCVQGTRCVVVAHDVDRLCDECRLGVPQIKGDCATNAGCVMVAVSDACAGACAASAGRLRCR
jgi:hypothetical protein